MYATTRIRVKGRTTKPAPVKATIVLYDAGRRLKSPDFGRGLSTTRYAGQHGFMPFTVEDDAWACRLSVVTGAEVDAAEDRFNEMLDQAALEDACLQRYTKGHLAL